MRGQAGFTVIELVVTLAIAGVMVALAAPNMGIFFKNGARTTMLNDFVTSIQYARNQAVTLNSRVSLCPVNLVDSQFDSANAADACLGTEVFETGWVSFRDDDADGQIDAGEPVLRVFATSGVGGVTFRGLDQDDAAVTSISYLGNGLGDNLAPLTHFKYCDDRADPNTSARAIILTGSGQPRISQDVDGNGIDNLTSTINFTCP